MASQIRITPEELREGATFIGQKEESIMGELQALNTKVEQVYSNWEGAAQNAFVQQFQDLYKTISTQLPQTLEGISAQLNGAADTLEEADAQIASAMGGK